MQSQKVEHNFPFSGGTKECAFGSKMECIIPCDKLCLYYDYILKQKGVCQTDENCAGYDCIAENTTTGCPSGQLFVNENTCVNIQDCMCVDYNGNLVKVCASN